MKIAFLGSLLTPAGSGVERAVRELLKACQRDCDVRVYGCAGFGGIGKLFRIFWEQAIVPLKLLRDKPDLLVAPAYVAPIFSPVPIELHVYDLHVFTHPETCTLANRLHYRALMPISLRRAKRVIVPSVKVRDAIVARFPDCTGKIEVIPLGVDRDVFKPAIGDPAFAERADKLRTRLGLPEHFALFVGNVAPRKGIVALAKRGLPIPLVIVGKASERVKRGIPSAIFSGRLSDEEIVDLYRMASMLVHPAIDEGFGLTVLEAMACGCPVIATPSIAPELLPGVIATESDDFPNAIQALLDANEKRDEAIARGLACASKFSWRRC